MSWNKTELLAILPQRMRLADYEDVLEVRLRLGKRARLVTARGHRVTEETVGEDDLSFVINAASRYSPWAAQSIRDGYLTAPGGHRIGVCGDGTGEGVRKVKSLCIRLARDIHGIASGLPTDGNLLLLGPPGSGKTTLLRDLIRKISRTAAVAVADERRELFPAGFSTGDNTDILSGIPKDRAIDLLLRSMGPEVIAMDEVTSPGDCEALVRTARCGVRLLATAHASSVRDLFERNVYRPLVETELFQRAVVLDKSRNWRLEEVRP